MITNKKNPVKEKPSISFDHPVVVKEKIENREDREWATKQYSFTELETGQGFTKGVFISEV